MTSTFRAAPLPRQPAIRAWFLALLAWLVTLLPATPVAAGTPWSYLVERVMQQPASKRAEVINLAINQFDHAENTGPTVWQAPSELAARGAGDCKDFALAKFWLLRHAGAPRERVRLAYGDWHAGTERRLHLVVLLWADDGSPLVLDNLVDGIHRLADRRDLDIRFSFDEQAFYDQVGQRRISDQPVKGWQGVWARISGIEARGVTPVLRSAKL